MSQLINVALQSNTELLVALIAVLVVLTFLFVAFKAFVGGGNKVTNRSTRGSVRKAREEEIARMGLSARKPVVSTLSIRKNTFKRNIR